MLGAQGLLDKKVKVNAKARVRGVLELDQHAADQRRLEPIVSSDVFVLAVLR